MVQPIVAGIVTAVVGFASSFAILLGGFQAVGASPAQAASGLLAACLAVGACSMWLSLRYRMPIVVAWSTPGAALLASTGAVEGGFATAVGAFLVSSALIVVAGLFTPLGRWIATIPQPIAAAMLAGVLLPLCLAPVQAVVQVPALAIPVVLVWLVLMRFARTWAVPAALVVAVVLIAAPVDAGWPQLAFTAPRFTVQGVVSIAVPLFLVTMASQNVPGMAVMAGFGYRVPLAAALRVTGIASAAASPFGGHAVNLAAISAALSAGPDAEPDPARRWIASTTSGVAMIALGLSAAVATSFVVQSPPILIQGVAGLALLGALTSAIRNVEGEAAIITFLVTASGVGFLGVGAAFWGLLAGGVVHVFFSASRTKEKISAS
ncbi:benzoate/H(+) symporter BenE family transporter [Herbidospora solisilvae]|uniref:benzoate/H(+) symporter BenE family transporter n=1 Tax=Herbidospora solisilvae TaxID=2696284 RepID=UPI001929807E|nr:benzoate/H(+) symporter BenE family transporter [Herbidospora solisilvae]